MNPFSLMIALGLLTNGQSPALDPRPQRGGGRMDLQHPPCVPEETLRAVQRASAEAREKLGLNVDPNSRGAGPLLFPFYPIGGNHGNDIFHGGFVDLDPTANIQTYGCLPFTYDGHAGIDTPLRSFGEQIAGVPVFAVLDSICTFSQDGWPDMNTGGGFQGNIIGLAPIGESREIWYYHLKNGSVAVSVGQFVKAGTQIGMVASSGNSYGPHLHFEVRDQPGDVVYEPFAGPCRAGPSGFANQPPLITNCFFDDFAFTHIDLTTVQPLPYAQPREGQIGLDDPYIRFWVKGHNLPVNATWRVRFYRPDNSVSSDTGWFFFNTEVWRDYNFPWEYEVPMTLDVTGTWHVRVDFSDVQMIYAPLEVKTTRTPNYNRPPQPITVAFDPPAPTENDAVIARVGTSVLIDDLDYDMVRYHYVWTVDGSTIRDVTTAGQADAIPHHIACPGSTIQCTVTPNDGVANGTPAIATYTLPGTLLPDLNCDCLLTLTDVAPFVAALLQIGGPAACVPARADANHDSVINARDIAIFVDKLIP